MLPSRNYKAVDIIAQAEDLVNTVEAKGYLMRFAKTYYNLAVSEIYLLFKSYNKEDFIISKDDLTLTTGIGDAESTATLSLASDSFAGLDDIDTILLHTDTNPPVYIDAEEIGSINFASALSRGYLLPPYELMIGWKKLNDKIHFIKGEMVEYTVTNLKAILYYYATPTMMTTANEDSLMVGIPDKYIALLTMRIASFAELMHGITDKALVLIKDSYEALLVNQSVIEKSHAKRLVQENNDKALRSENESV